MIIVKPKAGTLFSIGIFIAFCLAIAGYTATLMLSNTAQWYHYLIVITLAPVALGLMARTILGYKKIAVGKERIVIKHPTRFSEKNYTLKEIDHWTEQQVKTATGTFKEVTIFFQDGKRLNLSFQEHSNYPETVKYLRKKCSKKYKATA